MQNFKFKSFLKKIYLDKQIFNKKYILKYESNINCKIDNICDNNINKKNTFYMKYPSGIKYFGYGKTLVLDIDTKNSIKILKKYDYEILTNTTKKVNFFGGLSFDLIKKNYSPWKNIPKGRFIIPKILIKEESNKTTITYFKIINSKTQKSYLLNEFYKETQIIHNTNYIRESNRAKIKIGYENPQKNNYLSNIKKVINKINNKDLSKVVISRMIKYHLTNNLDKKDLIKYLNKKHKNCFNFFINFNKNVSFIGSTPEKLIRLSNKNKLSIDALAGSSKNKNDLKKIKEIDEHNYVIKHIKNIINPLCSKTNIPKNPKILDLNYIYHLITSISGTLKNKTHIIDLVNKLYPTPALLGYKSKKAIKIINNFEKFDRGWYGGCIGTFDTKGNGEFFVPIRSFLLKNREMYIFTGSGIVSKSDANKEWEETKIKSEHILNYFK